MGKKRRGCGNACARRSQRQVPLPLDGEESTLDGVTLTLTLVQSLSLDGEEATLDGEEAARTRQCLRLCPPLSMTKKPPPPLSHSLSTYGVAPVGVGGRPHSSTAGAPVRWAHITVRSDVNEQIGVAMRKVALGTPGPHP